MATIPVGGLATGLDTNGLVEQLMAVDRQSVTLLQTKKVKSQAQATAFQDLNSRILTLKSRAESLRDPATFFARSVTSSSEAIATATAGPGGSRGAYTLTVTALARGSIATAGATRASVTDPVAAAAGSVQFKLGATGSVIAVAVDATTTLDQLARAINDKNAGVRASVVNAGTSALPAWKLTLASNGTGASNDIAIINDATTLGIASTQTAVDAAFSLSGLGSFTRASNTFSDVLDGVTITLKAGTGSTDLVVDVDKATTQARVQALLDAYNDVVKAIDSQAAATVSSDRALRTGAFTGDAATRQIRRGLAAAIAERLSGSFRALAEIGVTTQKDGALALDGARFQQALAADAPGVRQLVAGAGSGGGIADLLAQRAAAATRSASGIIAVRQDAITTAMANTQKDIDRAQVRLEATERTLRARFANLERVISQLQQTGSALQSQLASISGNNSSSRR
jgi:flagellar hook-associated protein 2